MNKPKRKAIVDAWNTIEEMDPDASTERLFAMVCEHFNHAIDDGDVAEALYADQKKRGTP